MAELGEISYYVNDRLPRNPPLVVTDDDISGTFTFLRALPDYGCARDLTEADFAGQVNQSYGLRLQAEGNMLRGWVDGEVLFSVEDGERPLRGGAAAFVVEEGHMMSYSMVVRPISQS